MNSKTMVVTATTLMITMTTPTAAITIVSVFCCAIIVEWVWSQQSVHDKMLQQSVCDMMMLTTECV